MKNRVVSLIILSLLGIFLISAVYYLMPKKTPDGIIQTPVIIECTEVNLSSKITERVKEVKFEEGDYIKEGEIAVVLDNEKRRAEYSQAEANLEVAKANLLTSAADIDKAKVKMEDAARDLGRMTRLLDKKLVSQNDKDKAQTNYDIAVADLNRALAQEAFSKAGVGQAEAALEVARINLEDTVVKSTISGVIALKAFEPGETAQAGSTVLTVLDIADVWARADVEETAVSKIKIGDKARIKIDSLLKQEFEAVVSEINSEGEFATQRDVRRGRQDIKTFRVKAKIKEPRGILKQGMTGTATFIVR
ncbi:MAG: efflux RND transporter periplasmic adaptor subunit [Candidatus Omnitrophota bacterium]